MRTTLTNEFWLGVQLFFVISGYCIAAAVDNSREQQLPFLQFMRRRVRRIVPPYLGSLALAAVVKLATSADLFNGSRSLSRPWFWLSNLTLTQWSYLTARWLQSGDGLAAPWFNPILLLGVHWSLNYEEQFYLLCGLILIFHQKARPIILIAAFTAGIAFLNLLWPGRITGLFVDYWLQFFCGVLVYLRLCRSRSKETARALDALLIGAAIILLICAWRRGEFPLLPNQLQFYGQLAICALYALLLIGLRRYDEAAAILARGSDPDAWVLAYLLACYGQLGRSADARTRDARFREHWPQLSLLRVAAIEPYENAADLDHLLSGLRKAGVSP